ncbi:MAG: amidohydrolase family protein [Sphingomonadales bacterium]
MPCAALLLERGDAGRGPEGRSRNCVPLVVLGSDWPVVPLVNPWIAIETLVTRQAPGGGGEVLGAQEQVTLQQVTRLPARQMNFDVATGTIEKGKPADFIVLDLNIFEIPITDVHKTTVLRTFVGGEEVYATSADR